MANIKAVANMNNPVTLKGCRSLMLKHEIEAQALADRYQVREYVGVTMYGKAFPDRPIWAVMGGEVFCVEPMEWPEADAYIQGFVIVNPAI